jgi:hypothetical protein
MYKRSREFARRMGAYRGEYVEKHPVFPEGSQATMRDKTPVDMLSPDIEYSAEDDRAIDEYHRRTGPCFRTLSISLYSHVVTVETTWHSVGTNLLVL